MQIEKLTFYATINRQGTKVRIKPKHKLLYNHLYQREVKYGPIPKNTESTNDTVEFLKKEDYFKITGELKIGFGVPFIQVSPGRFFAGLIIANESMKKEVLQALGYIERKSKELESLSVMTKDNLSKSEEEE